MKKYIINHFHIHGNYIAGDLSDIHHNPYASFYQREHQSSIVSTPVAAEELSPVTGEQAPGHSFFRCITPSAIESGHTEQVEKELRSACVSAPKLMAAIRTNEALGYLDTKNLSSQALYNELNEHFHLPFTCHNFTVYRSRSH